MADYLPTSAVPGATIGSPMDPAPLRPNNGPTPAPAGLDGLEVRVSRLEATVAALQDTRQLEQRLTERVTGRLRRETKAATAAGVIVETGRQLLPAALQVVRAESDPAPAPATAGTRPTWLFFDLYSELRAIYWMLLDPRFRLSWSARVLPLVGLFFAVGVWFFFDGRLLYLGTIIDKVIDAAVVVLVYKILAREARRYREAYPEFTTRGG